MSNKILPEVVIGVFIQNKQGKIALFKSSKWKTWIPPGGHIEYGETIEEAVKREVKEEVGININNMKLIRVAEIIDNPSFHRKCHLISFQFLCSFPGNENFKLDNKEILSFKWFSINEALKLKEIDGETKKTLKAIKNN